MDCKHHRILTRITIKWDRHELEPDRGTMANMPFVTQSLQDDGAWYFTCYVSLLNPGKFSRTWTSEDEDKEKDLKILEDNNSTTLTITMGYPHPHHYTGCSRKNCTKFKHHNFATVHHRVMPFSAKCSERKCLHVKGQCLNTTIKYSLLCRQVKYLKTK